MSFRAGQKVVCVDANGATQLKVNAVYTVKEYYPPYLCRWRGEWANWPVVKLYETAPKDGFRGFCAERFKPVDERPTDISIFKKMLHPQKNRADA